MDADRHRQRRLRPADRRRYRRHRRPDPPHQAPKQLHRREGQFTRYELSSCSAGRTRARTTGGSTSRSTAGSASLLIYDKCWWNNRTKRYVSAKMHILESVVFDEPSGTTRRRAIAPAPVDLHLEQDLHRELPGRQPAAARPRRVFLPAKRHLQAPLPLPRQAILPAGRMDVRPQGIRLRARGPEPQLRGQRGQDQGEAPAWWLDELEEIGFLAPLGRDERYRKNGRDWTIRLVRNPPGASLAACAGAGGGAPSPLTLSVARGVTETTAAELVAAVPRRGDPGQDRSLRLAGRAQGPGVQRNPAGYLVDSIRKGYAPPKGFESEADRARRLERTAQAQATPPRRAAGRRTGDPCGAEVDAIEAYWRSLTPLQQERLDAEALATDPEGWESCRNKPALARMFRRNLSPRANSSPPEIRPDLIRDHDEIPKGSIMPVETRRAGAPGARPRPSSSAGSRNRTAARS